MENCGRHEYNIIVLGETGAGKSMFINSFGYYLQFNDLRSASRSRFKCPVPPKFTLYDEDGAEYSVEDGEDSNEGRNTAESRTIACKSYVYYVGNTWLRLIDSAGVGATQGMEMDERNIEDIIEFIARYQNLHAIVLVVKSTETRLTNTFKYCLSKLLNQLDKAAIQNLVFLLTFSDGSCYQPGDAKCLLKNILKEVQENHPELEVHLNKDNIYCVDNNCLKFIVAKQKGFEFEENNFENYQRCFEMSSRECLRLVKRVIGFQNEQKGLIPHPVRNILNISQARKFIVLITPILEDIRVVVQQNQSTLNELLSELGKHSRDMTSLESLISKRILDIEIEELRHPQTVCKSKKCRREVLVDPKTNLIKFHYTQVCCDACEAWISLRLFCQKFDLLTGQCRACGCPVGEHDKRYFRTVEVKRDVFNFEAFRNLSEKTTQKEFTRVQIERVQSKLRDLNEEKEEIEKSTVTFAQFLKENTAMPFTTIVENCYKQLGSKFSFDHAKTRAPQNSNANLRKNILPASASNVNIKIEDIFSIKTQLFGLKLYGTKIMRVCEIDERRNPIDKMENRQVDIKIGRKVADKFVWVYYKHGEYKNKNRKSGNSKQNPKSFPAQNFNKPKNKSPIKSAIALNPKPQLDNCESGYRSGHLKQAVIFEYDQSKNQVKKTLIVQETCEGPDLHLPQFENNITFYNTSSISQITPNSKAMKATPFAHSSVRPPFTNKLANFSSIPTSKAIFETPNSTNMNITPFVYSSVRPPPFLNESAKPSIARALTATPFRQELNKIAASNEVEELTGAFHQAESTDEATNRNKSDSDKCVINFEKNDNSNNNLIYSQFFEK